jgi:Ca2+-binding RTX toxin-like protein
MTGGAGNDSYFVRDIGDTVIEAVGGGSDAIATFITYTQLENDNVEALRLAGTGAINGTGNSAVNLIYSGAGNNLMDGQGGADWVAYSYATSGVTASLINPGVAQATGGSGSDTLISIENLIGSNFNDTLTGDGGNNTLMGGTGNDSLNGGGGIDVLTGGAGVDSLNGGLGADLFVLGVTTDSGTVAGARDIIADFLSGTDRIDLRGIDANTAVGADQAFTMINTAAFSNVAGQLRYFTEGTNTVMEGDVNGDGVADFQLQLTGNHTFVAADLLL